MAQSQYGTWWQDKDEEWYQLIYGHLRVQHEAFIDWAREIPLNTILEVGCGSAIYSDFFLNYKYTGIDISQKAINHAIRLRPKKGHKFMAGDFLQSDSKGQFDLVFSHSVIDHVYDINKFLLKIYNLSKKYIWITCFNGWNDQISEHQYEKFKEGYYINKVSIKEITRILDAFGSYFDIYPLPYGVGKTATIIKVIKDG